MIISAQLVVRVSQLIVKVFIGQGRILNFGPFDIWSLNLVVESSTKYGRICDRKLEQVIESLVQLGQIESMGWLGVETYGPL